MPMFVNSEMLAGAIEIYPNLSGYPLEMAEFVEALILSVYSKS